VSEEAEGLDIIAHGEEAYAAIGDSMPADESVAGSAHPVLKPARADV
jgi:hypothetical protein